MSTSPAPFDLEAALVAFRERRPERTAEVAEFLTFLRSDPAVFHRHHPPGHFTGAAWLVDRGGEHVLLTLHRKLGRWLQLGGHADGDRDLRAVALREAEEESGLCDLEVAAELFDLDRHRIPARGDEPEHWHYDLRFVVRCRGSEDFAVSEESLALAWRPIVELAAEDHADTLGRMARYWLQERG